MNSTLLPQLLGPRGEGMRVLSRSRIRPGIKPMSGRPRVPIALSMPNIGASAAANINAIDAWVGYALTSFSAGAYTWSTPLVDGDAIYIGCESFTAGSEQAGVWSVTIGPDGSRDKSRWSFKVSDKSLEPTGPVGVNSSPVMSDRALFSSVWMGWCTRWTFEAPKS
jgi:hypothetical protein